MDNPELYQKSNQLQIDKTKDFLDSYLKYTRWRPEGGDFVMDVGCGTGDVTCKVLKPSLPGNICGIIGSDVNEKMIRTARTTYKDQGVGFEVMDIEGEVPGKFIGKFDHVFSFFCLHWVENQQKAVDNIYCLLKLGGDGLLLLPVSCEQMDGSYEELATIPRWKKYMHDVERYFLPYRYDRNPDETLKKYLETAGFGTIRCEPRNVQQLFRSNAEFRGFLESVNPFVARMPEMDRETFMAEMMAAFKSRDKELTNDYETRNNILVLYIHVVK